MINKLILWGLSNFQIEKGWEKKSIKQIVENLSSKRGTQNKQTIKIHTRPHTKYTQRSNDYVCVSNFCTFLQYYWKMILANDIDLLILVSWQNNQLNKWEKKEKNLFLTKNF